MFLSFPNTSQQICLTNSSFLNSYLYLHLFCLDPSRWHFQDFLDKMDKLKSGNMRIFLMFSENSRHTYDEICMLLGQGNKKPKQIKENNLDKDRWSITLLQPAVSPVKTTNSTDSPFFEPYFILVIYWLILDASSNASFVLCLFPC